ncbi:MAG: hypothetical protein U5L75_00425 [Candidatus Campbellbacteria bacterium]|nr:hypothetical protein [Candidatus Campbellbacteria bacterium]
MERLLLKLDATASGDWMTEDFVSFTAEIDVEDNYSGEARLILHRANASGLPKKMIGCIFPLR